METTSLPTNDEINSLGLPLKEFSSCHFCSSDELIIANHVGVFHAGLPLPAQIEFFHIDSKCCPIRRPNSSSSETSSDCPYSGRKSHYHCRVCKKYFISVSEHSSDQCQSQLRCDVNKMVCSRPFCKLKKKQLHFHCSVCDQGFSDRIKFQMHATKHRNSSNNSSHHVQTMRKYNLGKRSEECSTASKLPVIMTDVSNKWTTRSDEDSLPLDLSVKKASPSDPPKSFSGELESVGLSNGEELPFTLRRIRFSL
ncbi:hypothetical protein RB195_017126 [Necator americanus]|uniref:C2H2-type domain-containing protein n=1 Tax=Necator americanus TaxID=51031 RepID=A0ABR1C3Q7_NECAM